MRHHRRSSAIGEIGLAPFIDVVFLLLCFFVVTTKFEDIQKLAVELPETHSQTLTEETEFLEIDLLKDGTIRIADALLQSPDNAQVAARLQNHATTIALLVKADKKVAHGEVVRIMDIATQLGFSKIHIASTADGSL